MNILVTYNTGFLEHLNSNHIYIYIQLLHKNLNPNFPFFVTFLCYNQIQTIIYRLSLVS